MKIGRFSRTSKEAWGDFMFSVGGVSVLSTDSQFDVFMLARPSGGAGLVFDGMPNVKTIKAARLILKAM